MNIVIIITLIVLLIIFWAQNKYIIYEDFSSDEAIQNMASLYNQSKLTVTDLISTGNTTVNGTLNTTTLNTNNATVNGILNTSALYSKGNGSGSTHFPYTDGNNYITGNNNILRGGSTTIQGQLNVQDVTNVGTLKVSNGIKLGPWNLIGNGNGLYLYHDSLKGGFSLSPNGGMTVESVNGTNPGQIPGLINSLNGVCPTCWPPVNSLN